MKKNRQTIKYFSLIIIVLAFVIGCSKEQKEIIGAIEDRSAAPRMHADSVTTIVSDSGITRYRISAPVWYIYDYNKQEPFWDFPKGIHFERFDQTLKVDANIHANYAKFFENRQLWELKGNVRATNIEGMVFVTEQMFWDQRAEKIFSDSLITITQLDGSKLVGQNGFFANQQLTQYTVINSKANIPVKE
ncbi:MAG: LPS export ABC transporter periplasmic protein LptC [Paludibacter sp.]|nr:LPS export ABC transporter periplasmic protein LptC [Paludibacter sp.]